MSFDTIVGGTLAANQAAIAAKAPPTKKKHFVIKD